MAIFRYECRGSNGKSGGILTAASQQEAEGVLRRSGKTILKLEEISRDASESPWFELKTRSSLEQRAAKLFITKAQQEVFLRQLNAMLAGGVPILNALHTIAVQSPFLLSRALFCTANQLRAGRSFSEALSAELPSLGKIIIGMIAAGELNGDIDRMCDYGAMLIADARALRYRIIQALAYPCFVVLALIGVVTFLVYKVIPEIISFISMREGAALPSVTVFLLDIISFIEKYSVEILVAPVVIVTVIWFLRMTPATRPALDRVVLSIPLVGKVFRSGANVLFCRILGILLKSGINIIPALEHAENAQPNRYYALQLKEIRELIALGHPLSTGLRVTALHRYVPLAEAMVVIGENTGRVDEGLLRVALFCEDDLKRRIALLSTLVEPALFVIVGGIVGFVYIAFFMALMSASQQ